MYQLQVHVGNRNSVIQIYPMLVLRMSNVELLKGVADNVRTSIVRIAPLSVVLHPDHHLHDDSAMFFDLLPAPGDDLPSHFQLARCYVVVVLVLVSNYDSDDLSLEKSSLLYSQRTLRPRRRYWHCCVPAWRMGMCSDADVVLGS